MAEPVDHGTLLSRPFTHQFVDIAQEDIRIELDDQFLTARFEITYHVNARKDGIRVPLLFYAFDLKDDFRISVDGKEVLLLDIPIEYGIADSIKFQDFPRFFQAETFDEDQEWGFIAESPDDGFYVELNDLKYFEADLLQGEHIVRVTYTANRWQDGWDWVNEYSFRYALSPARYWHAFGDLSITLDATAFAEPVTTTLGPPVSGRPDSIATWRFDGIPADILQITYTPEISPPAATLTRIRPDRLAYLLGILLVIIHLFAVRRYRIQNPEKRFSWVVIVGSLILPLIFLFSWAGFYPLIDNLIGEHASRQHGYAQLVVMLYPVVMPVYGLIVWLADKIFKSKAI